MAWNWESFVFAIISFGILYWLLNKYAFGPLFGIMEKRREQVLKELSDAENSRAEAAKLLEEQKQALEQARKDAHNVMEQARQTSSRQAEAIIEQAKAESSRIKEEALRDIENEKNKAVAALRSQVADMSVLIASKIIEKEIDEKSQQELVEQYLKKAGGEA